MSGNKIKTKVLIVNNIQSVSDEEYAIAYELLSEERKQKVNKIRFKKDKIQSIIVYCLLKHGLREFYNFKQMPNFSYNEYNKPYFIDSNIQFNLSHCLNAVCCSISYQEVGIDIQDKVACYENILNYSMNLNEIIEIESSLNPIDIFYRYWTLKESYLKCIGTGINDDLNKIDFSAFSQEKFYYKEHQFFSILPYDCCLSFCGAELPEVIYMDYQQAITKSDF
ncbi:4'-phosphopantetheinyl transferase family protein [Clostridium estertheticum]|uniref:4'-phosphopantetheinyl transferase family protein n=1 Tax=Clostridium estertheticum TaxID=238834 RepID=UPI001C0E016F|nr:4'-phosphopantetheinyl transferase superfamily protein [Clostridium estertheticum]MBU3186307.1 4'-phosphopantetheinyl transferase superfamily protein [Clostridium estertheticum]